MPRRRKGKVVRRQHNVSRDWRTGKASRILFLSLVATFAVCLTLTGSCLLQFGLPIFEMRTLRPMRCVLRREQYRRVTNCMHTADYSTHTSRFPCVEVRVCNGSVAHFTVAFALESESELLFRHQSHTHTHRTGVRSDLTISRS